LAVLLGIAVIYAGCGRTKGEASGAGTGAGGGMSADATVPVTVGDDAGGDAGIGPVDTGMPGEPPPLMPNTALHIAGDSTAAIFPPTDPTARVGWAAVLQQFFTDAVRVDDAARSGRSSKSFIDEGLWTALKAQIHAGDYVFIQFAHNDEKTDDPARYTDPATTFRDYLEIYVGESRALGAFPVLLTPICRRDFSGTMVVNTHGAYPAAVAAVADQTGTPLIDMTEKTRVLLESLGPTNSIPLFAMGDNTHLSAVGAPMVAQLAVDGIRELGLPLADALLP
jgi:lysophospholipase L1-like esterase